jgi:hypothetical protein
VSEYKPSPDTCRKPRTRAKTKAPRNRRAARIVTILFVFIRWIPFLSSTTTVWGAGKIPGRTPRGQRLRAHILSMMRENNVKLKLAAAFP